MKLRNHFVNRHFLIILILMIFSGGFGFAGAGKIKPASGETINLVWNGTGTGWTATNGSGQTINVKWLNQNGENVTSF